MATATEISRIQELRAEGRTQQAIANEIGRSRSYVQKVLAKHPVSASRGVAVREERPRLVRLVKRATPWAQAEGSQIGQMVGQTAPIPDNIGEWASFGLEKDVWQALGKNMTLSTLSNVSPGVSRAIWDFLLMLDPGHEIHALVPGTEEIDESAQAELELFIEERINPMYGSTKGFFEQLFMGALYRGAFCAQLVTDENGREPIGIVVPDPIVIQFRAIDDPDVGPRWVPGITVDGNWESVESEFFEYVGVHRLPGEPYGRSMIAPAAFPSMFMTGLLYDLRRVVAQQGYPRTEITVMGQRLREAYEDVEWAEFRELLEEMVEEVSSHYGGLQPDDAFVKTDAVEVGDAPGAVGADVISGAVALIEVLERMEARALKTMPLLMGIMEGGLLGDNNSNRQWEVFAQGIRSIQQLAEALAERRLKLMLEVKGIQADVRIRFAEVRTAEIERDETAKKLKMENAAYARDQGWINQDEAAFEAVGHAPSEGAEKAEEPTGGDADGGENVARFAVERHARQRREVRAELREDDTGITRRLISAAVRNWTELMSDRPEAEMLTAERVPYFEAIEDESEQDWHWLEDSRQYVYQKVDRIDSPGCRDILDAYADLVRDEVGRLVDTASIPDPEARGWQRAVQALLDSSWRTIERSLVAGAILGAGGVDGILPEEALDKASERLQIQRDYWAEFEDEILSLNETRSVTFEGTRFDVFEESEEAFLGYLSWRMLTYVDAGADLYEVLRAREWDVTLPAAMPAHPHCRCFYEYGSDLAGPYVSWRTSGGACPACNELAHTYVQYRGQ